MNKRSVGLALTVLILLFLTTVAAFAKPSADISTDMSTHTSANQAVASCAVDFNPTLEWEWTTSNILPDFDQVTMTPVVMDMNGDDSADILFITHLDKDLHQNAHLRVINGHDGSDIFTITDEQYDLHGGSQLAVGDIDLDGKPEILAISELDELIAFEHDGTFKWRSVPMVESDPNLSVDQAAPSIADLNQDGTPEIVVGHYAFDNQGNVLWVGEKGRGDHRWGPLSMVLDLDLDGSPEVLAGNSAYRANGDLYWHYNASADGFTSIGNLDDDPNPEILLITYGKIRALEHDGTLKWNLIEFPGVGSGGAPAVGDMDGDGQVEIGVANNEYYMLYEADGTLKWQTSINSNNSGVESSSLFDFDGDGAPEILYSDQLKLYIFNGSDGTILWETESTSRGGYEYPVVADVDNDGRAEIIMSSNNKVQPAIGGNHGIQVYGHESWPSTREVWNQYSYHIDNVNDNGSIPLNEAPSWMDHNTYHLNPSAGCSSDSCTPTFADKQIIDADFDGAISVYHGDIDGDGDVDIVGAGQSAGQITWWENNGGTFSKHVIDDSFGGAFSVYVDDIDGDGDLDVLGAGFKSREVAWWANNGDGSSWTKHVVSSNNEMAYSVRTADFNGDGHKDVVAAFTRSEDVIWWSNNGDGTVWNEHVIDTDFYWAQAVETGDIDGDGHVDVLGAASEGNDIAWWRNNGDGSGWTEYLIDGYFGYAVSVQGADVDGDGDLDLLGAATRDNEITWWENDGSPLDGGWIEHVISNQFNGASWVDTTDMDQDGDLDVLGAGHDNGGRITWWENNGDGSNWFEHVVETDFDGAHSVIAVDLDWDEDLDLVGAAYRADDIAWWENECNDVPPPPPPPPPTCTPNFPSNLKHLVDGDFDGGISVYPADIDRDGDLDILGAAQYADDITWWENNGDGTALTKHTIDGNFDGAFSVYADDVDDDGDLDVLGAAFGTNEVAWWENHGNGTSWSKHVVGTGTQGAYSVRTGDFDGDGDRDVVGAFVDDKIVWWTNNGNGTWTEHIIDTDFDGAQAVEAVDLDQDGDLDILGAARYGHDVTWWENSGNGSSWTEHLVDGEFRYAVSVQAADVDGDGDLDLLGAATNDDDITWWENDGNAAGWSEHLIDGEFDGASWVSVADMDKDGDIDVLGAARDGGGEVTWWQNNGTGSSWTEYVIETDFDGGHSVFAADMDGDNDLDILAAAYRADDVAWWENDNDDCEPRVCTPAFSENSKHIVDQDFDGAISTYPADVNGDGDIDILAAGQYADDITWWENNGDGSLLTKHTIDDNFDGAFSVYADDVDQDGDIDVLGAGFGSNQVAWWANNGDGTWTKHVIGTGTQGAYSVRTGDIDGDGDRDAVGAFVDDKIIWWTNNGDNTWTEHVIDSDFDGAQAVEVVDLDQDGDMDVLGAARYGNDITWWENNSNGASWTEHLVDGEFRYAVSVQAADIDGDGDLDLLGAATNDDDITWWENDGNNAGWTEHLIDGEFDGASWVSTADMDFDGDIDVLGAARDGGGEVAWWENDGTGMSWTDHVVDTDFDGGHSVFATDINGDKSLDILAVAYRADDVAWWENDSSQCDPELCTPAFPTDEKHVVDADLDGVISVYTTDLDDDGDNDILSASQYAGDITWWENNGDGSSLIKHTIDGDFKGAFSVYADDVDGDGDLDVLGAGFGISQIAWWENDGNGTWAKHVVATGAQGAYSARTADFDGDGDRDVVGAFIDNKIVWWANNGDGTSWTEHVIDSDFGGAQAVEAVDLDQDGDMDVLGAARYGDDIAWWENSGNGSSWTEHLVDGEFNYAVSVQAADIDQDGDLDLVGAATLDDDITWWENDGNTAGWTPHLIDGDFDGASWVSLADMDEDGDLDVLGAARDGGGAVAWWQNDGTGTEWSKYVVEDDFDGGHSVFASDINGDNELDIVAVAFRADDVVWWGSNNDHCDEVEPPLPPVMCERADYNAQLKWEWTTSSTLPDSKQVMMTPMVMDITGDGIADVVFVTHEGKPMDQDGHLRAINGSDGSEIFTVTDSAYDLYGTSQVALGDVDNDGLPEIFGISESDELLAFEHDGTFKWRSIGIDTDDASKKVLAGAPAIADLDQDGTPEIIVGSHVFNNDGSLRWKGKHSRGDYRDGPLSMVLDLDLDGKLEVLAGNTAYRADGTVHWKNYHMVDGFNSVGNFDDDPYPEIVFITFAGIRMFEHDGSVKWGPIDPPGDGSGGAPAVADVDGDGQAEIGIANKNYFMVYEGDGTLKWQTAINDTSSGTVSASMFDFEGDGAAEIIARDQEKIYILQGDNGTVLWETESPSRTVYEYPVVADVDGDGHAELIVPSNNFKAPGGKNGIQVYGHDSWAGTRDIWNQYSYHISNVNDDGTIPQYESDSWRGHNTYHLNWSDCDNDPPTPPPPPPPPLPKCEDINYNASLQWEWNSSEILPEFDQVTMTPSVMDMNGDGSADILFITHLDKDLHQNAHLRVVNGHDGSEIFTVTDEQYQLHGGSQLAVGDIDLDGKPEILAISELDELIAFEHDGTFKWRSDPIVKSNSNLPDLFMAQAAPSIADLDQDGTPEIIVGHHAFDNQGNVLWIGEKGRGDHRWGPLSMVLDLDLDGSPEVLAGNSAYRADGTLYWHYNPAADGFTSIGNLDDDANPEILLITYGKIRALEHDGTLKWNLVEFPGIGSGGAPAVGDVDGDGQVEIGVANNEYYMLYEADGTLKWKNSITSDKSGVESSSLFDFDGDGAPEILYSDQLNLYIFNGSDGAILWQTQSTSRGGYEYPVIADVDNDGRAEIVVSSNNKVQPAIGGNHGIQVYGHESWPSTRSVWNQYSYHINNVNDDGSIPQYESNSWQEHNTYHLNPSACWAMCEMVDYQADLEWQWTDSDTLPDSIQVAMTPVVMDITGDGVPDVLFITHTDKDLHANGHLRAIDGADGSEIFTITDSNYNVHGGSQLAVGDIDLDGLPEVLALSQQDELIAFEHDGTFKWRSSVIDKEVLQAAPAIADINTDGTPEIIVGAHVFNNDGSLRWVGSESRGDQYNGPLSMVVDLDMDGTPELLAGNMAYRSDGTVYWKNNTVVDGFNGLGNFDADAYPEVLLVTYGKVRMLEHDGTLKWGPIFLPGDGSGGAPAVADVDGDGQAEMAIANKEYLIVLEGDGSIKWQKPFIDKLGIASASMFDFDNDGIAEIIYSGEQTLTILRGRDGSTLWETSSSSRGSYQYPLVVDVDGDGHVEIVMGSNNRVVPGRNGIQVYGHESWPSTRQVWNQYTYHITNVNSDGSIPQHESNSWDVHNTYHLNPTNCGIDLAVTKENDVEFVYQGDTIPYTITVESLSTVDATGVVVSDTLPANTSFVSASHGGTEAGGTVTWNLGEMLADSSITLDLTIRVNDNVPADGRTLTNWVSVTDDGTNGPDQNPDDNRNDHVDYVDTSEPSICTATFPDKQIINGDFDGSISVYPADMDGDGDQDLLGAGQYADDITWWENDGTGTFTEHTIDDNFDGAFSVYADDVDQDGDMDILGAAFGANEVVWWANNGDRTWTKHVIGTSTQGAYSVRTADVDGDGDLDTLGAWVNSRITWWANNGDGTSWTEHEIDTDFGGAQAVEVADLDADGDIDVLGAARYGNDITWWENSGNGSSWTEHVVDAEFRYAVSVEAVDMDNDGDLDLLGSATDDDDITWWENDGNATGWAEHIVDGEFDGASWATAIDMDYDGDLDVLGAGRDGGEVAWWQNRGGDGTLWSKHLVDDQFRGSHSIYAVDLDGNYALDIVAAAYIEDDVAWWRNDCEYAPDLAVTKDDGLSLVRQGNVITYTIQVDNNSVRDGTGVVLTDNLSDHTTFVSASDGGSEADGVVTWNIGTISGNSSVTRTVTVQVNSPLPLDLEYITNTTSVKDDGANGPDPNPDNNWDDDVDEVKHPGHIKGNLRLVGRDNGDTPAYNGAVITLRDSNGVIIDTTTSDTNGDFKLNNVPTGPNTPYTIRAEMELFLPAERNVTVLENETSTMPFLPLWPGDGNGDGKVNTADLLPLISLLNDGEDIYSGMQCANGTSWNPATEARQKQLDFNGNCIVDITDIGLHSGTIAAFFSGTNGSVGLDMPIVQITPGSPAEGPTPWVWQ